MCKVAKDQLQKDTAITLVPFNIRLLKKVTSYLRILLAAASFEIDVVRELFVTEGIVYLSFSSVLRDITQGLVLPYKCSLPLSLRYNFEKQKT